MKIIRGFTIVELVVVIAVIAILASISYFTVTNWRQDAAETQVKNELSQATTALANHRNFSNSYPTTANFVSVYSPGADVSLSYTLRADGSYCLNGESQVRTSITFNVDSRVGDSSRSGTCTP